MLKKNHYLLMSLLLMQLAIISCSTSHQRPNIVFIIADDMKPEINSYGIERAITPNLDRLAAQGVMFTRAYCQQAICAASRASLLIGMRPDAAGCDYPYSDYYVNELLPEHPTLFTTFNQIGYHLETLGKLHHGYLDPVQVNHREFRTDEYYDQANRDIYHSTPGKRSDKIARIPPFELADLPDSIYDDGRMAIAAAQFIREYAKNEQSEPFFLGVGFWKPHLPFVAPEKYAEPYKTENIVLSPNKDHSTGNPYSVPFKSPLQRYLMEENVPGRLNNEGYDCSDQRARELIRAYLACCSFIDAQVGIIIDALKESGMADNTIIVFTSDHGYHLGDHKHWGKTTNFECSARIPLIVVDPRVSEKGVVCDALVELVDIYPSLVDMAGSGIPRFCEGTSFKTLLADPGKEWKTAAFTQFPRGKAEGYSIRTDQYRYIEWRQRNETGNEVFAAELYSHIDDPLEMDNLADDPVYAEIRKQLSAKLTEGWKQSLPEGFSNHSDNPIAPPAKPWSGGDERMLIKQN